jgi:hypothetical protein
MIAKDCLLHPEDTLPHGPFPNPIHNMEMVFLTISNGKRGDSYLMNGLFSHIRSFSWLRLPRIISLLINSKSVYSRSLLHLQNHVRFPYPIDWKHIERKII